MSMGRASMPFTVGQHRVEEDHVAAVGLGQFQAARRSPGRVHLVAERPILAERVSMNRSSVSMRECAPWLLYPVSR